MEWRKWFFAKRQSAPSPAVEYLRNIGGGLSLLGIIGLFPSPDFYWVGVGAFYLGLVLLTVEAYLESWVRYIRILMAIVYVLAASLFTFGYVARAASLDLSAISNPAELEKSPIAGMTWRPQYSELDLIIGGKDIDYSEINLHIKPDYPIAKIAQLTNISDVLFEDEDGMTTHVDSVSGGVGRSIPLELIATNAGYLVHCGKLDGGLQIKVIIAVVDMNYNPPPPNVGYLDGNYVLRIGLDNGDTYWLGYPMGDYYGHRPPSRRIDITGNYVAYQRRRRFKTTINVAQIPMQPVVK